MSILKALYRQIRNEYVQNLCRLGADEFMSAMDDILVAPPVTLGASHIHQIWKRIDEERVFRERGGPHRNIIFRFWKNLLKEDQSSLLIPTASRRGIVSRWFGRDWESQILETIARHAQQAEWGLTADDWQQKISHNFSGSHEIAEKNNIAFEQSYRLASDRQEKCRILLSGWKSHFRLELVFAYFFDRMKQMLEEHIRQFPGDVPWLQKTFLELITHGKEAWERRAGWAGMAVVGAGTREDQLFDLLKQRMKMLLPALDGDRGKPLWQAGATVWQNIREEIEGMTHWVPDSESHRRDLLEIWKKVLPGSLSCDNWSDKWNDFVSWKAIWQARFRLETSEDELLEEITERLHGLFEKSHSGQPENEAEEIRERKQFEMENELIRILALWEPRSPEIRQRWRELWENCLLQRWGNPNVPEWVQGLFWECLINIDPRNPRLGEILLHCLSSSTDGEDSSWENVVFWLWKYGLPPETLPEIRQQLEDKAWEDLRQGIHRDHTCVSVRIKTSLNLYILLSTGADLEGRHPDGTAVVAGNLQNDDLLDKIGYYLRYCPPTATRQPTTRQLQSVVCSRWEKKLTSITSTRVFDAMATIISFSQALGRTPTFQPSPAVAEKLLFLIREGENRELITLAARMGGQLIREGRVEETFFEQWNETVRRRAEQACEQGDKLSLSLHVIRQEALLWKLSICLTGCNGLVKEGGEKRTGKNRGNKTAGKADRETTEIMLLRELVYMFPEISDRNHLTPDRFHDQPLRIWSQQCIKLIIGEQQKQATNLNLCPWPEANPGRPYVFGDNTRFVIPPAQTVEAAFPGDGPTAGNPGKEKVPAPGQSPGTLETIGKPEHTRRYTGWTR